LLSDPTESVFASTRCLVIGTRQLPGTGVDVDTLPNASQTLRAGDLRREIVYRF